MSATAPIIELVFDRSEARDGRSRAAVVAELRRVLAGGDATASLPHFAATSVPSSAVLAAPEPIASVLPTGGIARGSIVSVGASAPGGGGATSLLLALMAAPAGAWIATVGLPQLGLLAAAEMGVDFTRLGVVPDPGPDLAQIISVLADGVDVIAVSSPFDAVPRGRSSVSRGMARGVGIPPARQRVMRGRLREGGAVLLVAGRWPGADLSLTVREVRWTGIGEGHGRLRDRELDVEVGGRRAGSGTGAVVTVALRAVDEGVAVVAGTGLAESLRPGEAVG